MEGYGRLIMGFRFLLYIGILLMGILIGYKEISHPKLLKRLDQFQFIALILLLLVMGIRIGAEDLVMDNLGMIGLRALSISAGTILCSVLFVWIYRKFSGRNNNGEKVGE